MSDSVLDLPQPTTYVTRPTTITAMQFDGSIASGRRIIDWAGDDAVIRWTTDTPQQLGIETLEGTMKAAAGAWVIKGTEGEFYPCKDSVFQRKYQAAPVETQLAALKAAMGEGPHA
jgi:hypothetical protein